MGKLLLSLEVKSPEALSLSRAGLTSSLVTREASGESEHLPTLPAPLSGLLSLKAFLPHSGPQFLPLAVCRCEHPSHGSVWSRMFAKPLLPWGGKAPV